MAIFWKDQLKQCNIFVVSKKHWEYILNIGEKYIAPYKSEADLVLNGNSDLKYFSQALEYIHAVTNNFNE